MGKLISNYFFTVLHQLLLMLTPFITTPYVARILKAEGVGTDAYVLSIVQIFIVFIVLNLPMYGSRQIAIKKNQEEASVEFWSIFTFQLIVSILNLIVYLIFIQTLSSHKELYYIHISTLLAYSLDVSWYFIGKEQIKRIAIRNMITKIAGIFLIFTFVKHSQDLPLYVAINGGTLLIGQLIMWRPLFKEIKFVKLPIKDMKEHIRPIFLLFIPQLMIQVYALINRIVLGNVSGEIQVGYYNQAYKVERIAIGLFSSMGTVLLPRMASEFSKGNKEQLRRYTDYTLRFVLMITLPMTLGLMAISPNFVKWFLGTEFTSVSNILILMCPDIIFVGLANVFGIQILVATQQQNKYTISITVGAFLSLLINLLLVHSHGSIGTTIALLVAEGVGAVFQMYYARKYFHFKNFLLLFIKYLILSVFVFIVAVYLGKVLSVPPMLLTVIQLLAGVFVYLFGLLIVRDPLLFKTVRGFYNRMFLKYDKAQN
ncbi:oligosaccharide flippase family protein [Bacillus sp. USDA818B3_A]|uniref:oligosaccharide flippase family protein n=1 Tax=Bacillus sp. USDA818B3_A TaxID=2698834 RepID=UPI00136BFC83|nr:oligosaccharide flippase family protein [Bacillus sp. USDA818B3_A]